MSANQTTRCFDDECVCACGQRSALFDDVIRKETLFGVTLKQLCHSNVGWFNDRTLGESYLGGWRLSGKEGVYLLWHKNAYCAAHERYHMRALYVGKGLIYARLWSHWEKKDFSQEMLVYWTFLEMPNRQAKYVEQLLLDLYRFPHNAAENPGGGLLCAHWTQDEVD